MVFQANHTDKVTSIHILVNGVLSPLGVGGAGKLLTFCVDIEKYKIGYYSKLFHS